MKQPPVSSWVGARWLIFLLMIQWTPPKSLRSFVPIYIHDSIYTAPDNAWSETKAAIGRYLFYDRRLSINKTKSCASCHDPAFAFTDGYRRSIGAFGDLHQRNSVSLVNVIFRKYLTASDPRIESPEMQINNPMFHEPAELGWKGNEAVLIDRIRKDPFYSSALPTVFRSGDAFTVQNIQYCICSFVKSLISFNAPYDGYCSDAATNPLTPSQLRGIALFSSQRLSCSRCHGGIDFSTPQIVDSLSNRTYYFNTGLYNVHGQSKYPGEDRGLSQVTGNSGDDGKFRVPSLRNLAFTAPYFHDGSAATLDEVIAVYERGGRNITNGPLAGDGRTNCNKSQLVGGFSLTLQERRDLIAFLLTLSDSSICHNPKYANPFAKDETH